MPARHHQHEATKSQATHLPAHRIVSEGIAASTQAVEEQTKGKRWLLGAHDQARRIPQAVEHLGRLMRGTSMERVSNVSNVSEAQQKQSTWRVNHQLPLHLKFGSRHAKRTHKTNYLVGLVAIIVAVVGDGAPLGVAKLRAAKVANYEAVFAPTVAAPDL